MVHPDAPFKWSRDGEPSLTMTGLSWHGEGERHVKLPAWTASNLVRSVQIAGGALINRKTGKISLKGSSTSFVLLLEDIVKTKGDKRFFSASQKDKHPDLVPAFFLSSSVSLSHLSWDRFVICRAPLQSLPPFIHLLSNKCHKF